MPRFSEEVRLEIATRFASGEQANDLVAEFGCEKSYPSKLAHRYFHRGKVHNWANRWQKPVSLAETIRKMIA